MALPEHKIGTHQFIALDGEPIPPRMAAMLDDRPGVDGTEKILVGTKGEPFSLISKVDSESYLTAKALIDSYKLLIDGDAVVLVQGDVRSDGLGYLVLVLNVTPLRCYAIRGATGNNLNPPSQGFCEARWDLVAVPI